MPYRALGRCGTKVSAYSLGGWTTFGGSLTDEAAARSLIKEAFDAGINFYDIADVYSGGEAEKLMGKILADFPRRHLVISSKVYFPFSEEVNDRGLSRKHIMESVHDSLKRVGTDYLDIYFCHRFDAHTPMEETVRAMDDLVHQGKVLYWGTSGWSGPQLKAAHRMARRGNLYGPQVEQPCYNLLNRRGFERDVSPAVRKLGMGTVIYSPLASGLLTGKYDSGLPADSRLARIDWLREQLYKEKHLERTRAFKTGADAMGHSRSQIALAWVAAQPGVSSVILGASRLEQLKENLGALAVSLDAEALKALNKIFPAG